MKTVSVKVASAVIAGLGLTVGVVGAVGAQTGTIGETGEDSTNTVLVNSDTDAHSTKNASVHAENNNAQTAVSGDATVEDGDDDGSALSGEATNNGTAEGTVTVDQGPGGGGGGPVLSESYVGGGGAEGSISGPTGEGSTNSVEVNKSALLTQEHNANVNIVNNNPQHAESGAATVIGGNDGGTATSGTASNTSNTTFTIGIKQ